MSGSVPDTILAWATPDWVGYCNVRMVCMCVIECVCGYLYTSLFASEHGVCNVPGSDMAACEEKTADCTPSEPSRTSLAGFLLS